MHVDICICTHNPRLDILRIVIDSIARQATSPALIKVLLVDNVSTPPLDEDVLAPISKRGIACRIVREPELGISKARLRAINETDDEWILFVDDDNELDSEYIEQGLAFIRDHPDVGCLGGRLILARNIYASYWVEPFLPFLGIKDEGDMEIFGTGERWGPWEPPTAGAWVHRKVLNEYSRRARQDQSLFRLGRGGKQNLSSCEDSILMRGSRSVGMMNAYAPGLSLNHHLDEKRFHFWYLMRLMWGYGLSHVVLETVLQGPQPVPEYYRSRGAFLKLLASILRVETRKSVPFAIGLIAYHLGARREHYSEKRMT